MPGSVTDRNELVSPANFLLATRDSGYRSTSLSIAEFVDNSVQAGAKNIHIDVCTGSDEAHPIEIRVVDDGAGMDEIALSSALKFGGSTRFGNRASLGRYGMGLPNGALSRARRVEVYTWRHSEVLMALLDIDEILRLPHAALPPVSVVSRPDFIPDSPHGTAVRLLRCDRLDFKRPSTLSSRLQQDLGRIYRRFLWGALAISVNGTAVQPSDPLLLEPASGPRLARQFGDALTYRIPTEAGDGQITVRFSELAVERLHTLPSDQKKRLGITGSPPVSVLRSGREIDRGWYFMGTKRRENYDDWWRCEINFDPCLDEFFGITHSKQQICPSEGLLQLLAPDLEAIARALNGRVRRQFELSKTASPFDAAQRQAARADGSLPALPLRSDVIPPAFADLLNQTAECAEGALGPYVIRVTEMPATTPFEFFVQDQQLVVLINAKHPLYRDVVRPLAESDSKDDHERVKNLALTILAAARAEASTPGADGRSLVGGFRHAWGDALATFLNASSS